MEIGIDFIGLQHPAQVIQFELAWRRRSVERALAQEDSPSSLADSWFLEIESPTEGHLDAVTLQD